MDALDKLDRAHIKDPQNFEIRNLRFKILTELGMEYSFVGKYMF